MTKLEVVKAVAKETGIERSVVASVIDAYVGTIKSSLLSSKPVNFRGFGTFYLKHRAEKTGRNITRNTTIRIPAHNIAAFKPAKEFAVAIAEETK